MLSLDNATHNSINIMLWFYISDLMKFYIYDARFVVLYLLETSSLLCNTIAVLHGGQFVCIASSPFLCSHKICASMSLNTIGPNSEILISVSGKNSFLGTFEAEKNMAMLD